MAISWPHNLIKRDCKNRYLRMFFKQIIVHMAAAANCAVQLGKKDKIQQR